ncbi:uncharacterized protein LOC130669856 [Microplitis mediator]|uniref:uncharacterized protein LOC130669856 n=1 Tax=Microplitis mediator TaxID=375433 RepID=UPI0025550F82|nr:uncharacterized protein LOC130669856 [Microplitis mediator]
MDLQRLINEVQARPAIWDQKNTHYHNRDVILKMWGEIARACDVSCEVAKSKWKHLRDNFRNELKKTYRSKPTCDSSSPSSISEQQHQQHHQQQHESKWVWFKSLLFLRDQMNSRVIGCGNGGSGLVQTGGSHYATSLDGTQIEPQIDIFEGDEEAHFDDGLVDGDSCQSLLTGDELLQVGGIPIVKRVRNKINRKRVLVDSTDCDYQSSIERKRYESIHRGKFFCHTDDNNEDDDDTYHFLMSIRSPLRSLTIERQMFVRLKIQEIILNEITNQQQYNFKNNQNIDNSKTQNNSPETANNDNCLS